MTTAPSASEAIATENKTSRFAPRAWPRLLEVLFALFAAELAALIALWRVLDPTRHVLNLLAYGWDFGYFYQGALDWLHHRNPYAHFGFVTPPPSVLPGVLLAWLPEATRNIAFGAINAVAVLAALYWFAREIGLDPRRRTLLMLVALVYGPFLSQTLEGNLDGLMLVLLVVAYCSRGKVARAVAIAFSIGLKLYTAVILFAWLRKRQWISALILLMCVAALFACFGGSSQEFVRSLLWRVQRVQWDGNISPAYAMRELFGEANASQWKPAFVLWWTATLLVTLWFDRERAERSAILTYIPWMIAMPTHVFAYEAVLVLPLIAVLAKSASARALGSAERIELYACAVLGLYPGFFSRVLPPSAGALNALLWHADVVRSVAVMALMAAVCVDVIQKRLRESSQAQA